MAGLRVRVIGWLDGLRTSMWLLPTLAVLSALVFSLVLVVAGEPLPYWLPESLFFLGGPEGARSVLSTIAGATVTVVGLVFSLTVIALQMASSQFSPRLLRSFLSDRGVQIVLSGMLGSAVFDIAVLRTVRDATDDTDAFVPRLAVSAAMILAVGAVGLLVYFLHHVTRLLRVDVVMRGIAAETLHQMSELSSRREVVPDQEGDPPPAGAHVVTARLGGYLQQVDVEMLAVGARTHRVVVRLRPVMGQWVTKGTTLAWVWGETDPRAVDAADAADLVHEGLHLGPDRTESADLAFGMRQLQDIAARALSPGVNDPTTAVQAIGQLAALMGGLAGHPLGADIDEDPDGRARVIAPRPTFAAYLELAVGQSRRYGCAEPAVLIALLQLLTDLAEHVADDADRAATVRGQIDRVEGAGDLPDAQDAARLHAAADLARRTLELGIRPVAASDAG